MTIREIRLRFLGKKVDDVREALEAQFPSLRILPMADISDEESCGDTLSVFYSFSGAIVCIKLL